MRRGVFLALVLLTMATPALAQSRAADCNADVDRIERAETELPRLEVAPPGDKQIVCITIETNLVFGRRLLAHIQQCPRSPYAREREKWSRLVSTYGAEFRQRECKAAITGYRG